jgi:Na+/proline symporter
VLCSLLVAAKWLLANPCSSLCACLFGSLYYLGATIQVLLFAVLAVEIKRKAPTTHTVLEIVHARWGTIAHLVFLVFCLLTNIIVTSMLILGGAAVVNALTGE